MSRTSAVEAWATERLPFEPKGWMLELRSALRQMRSHNGALLAAVYSSQVDAFCDVENVVIYNVGAGNFAATASAGLRLERGYFCPPAPVELSSEAEHTRATASRRSLKASPAGDGAPLWLSGPAWRMPPFVRDNQTRCGLARGRPRYVR